MNLSKEQIVQVIRESRNLEDAATRLNTNRRTLNRIRNRLEITHVTCNGNQKDIVNNNKNKLTLRHVIKALGLTAAVERATPQEARDHTHVEEYSIETFEDFEAVLAGEVEPENKEKPLRIEEIINENLEPIYTGKFKEKTDKTHTQYSSFVITSVQNNTEVNEEFLATLKAYCKKHNAKLIISPVFYNYSTDSVFNVDVKDMFFENVQVASNLKLLSKLKILPTIVDPFAGIESLSKGDSIIVPHPQVSMKTIPTLGGQAAQMFTTGSISLKEGAYARTKTGYKAEFNHSLGALVVNLGEGESFHIRQLNCDENNGFYDIDGYYSGSDFTPLDHVEAIIWGDTHAGVIDPGVLSAGYTAKDSMIKVLKPKYDVHHDILDFSSKSHHDDHDYILRVAKSKFGLDSVESELNGLGCFVRNLVKLAPDIKHYIAGSNHNEHLYKWLTTTNPKQDVNNAEIYHLLSYLMIKNMKAVPNGVSYPNVLELWFQNSEFSEVLSNVEFLDRRNGFKIKDIEISMHGDKGPNGARGSPNAFSRLPTKSIVGHSHSPSIRLGCYTVGTSSMLNLSYNAGASSWMHTHCVIYPNGKRQMINIINGKWKAN